MPQQPQVPNSASSAAARPAAAARAAARGERSWFDDVRPARRLQASPETRIPVSETAISQADGEA